MTDLFSKLTEAADLALDERERTEKLEREIEKLKAIVSQQRLASASALAFLKSQENPKAKPSSGAKYSRPTNSMTKQAGYFWFAISATLGLIQLQKVGTQTTLPRTTLEARSECRFANAATKRKLRNKTCRPSPSQSGSGISTLASSVSKAGLNGILPRGRLPNDTHDGFRSGSLPTP